MKMSAKPRRPAVIIDFSDELARQLASSRVEQIIKDYIESEASTDSAGASKILGVCADEFRARHAKKIPVVELGLGAKGNRYRLKDIIEYRDKNISMPKR